MGGPTTWYEGGGVSQGPTLTTWNAVSIGGMAIDTKYAINSIHRPLATDFHNDVPFGSAHPGGANFLFCDGHASSLSENIDMIMYRDLSTRAGNEVIKSVDY